MSKLPKHLKSLIKEEFRSLFGVAKIKYSELHIYENLAKLVFERGDENRIMEIYKMFKTENLSEFATVNDLYFWYKKNQLSDSDLYVYKVFMAVSSGLKLPKPRASDFSGLGRQLIEKLEIWKGEAGNKIEDILIDYFSGVIPAAVKFNSILASQPKSLLGPYGWSLFENWIDEVYKGKHNYFELPKKEKEEIERIKPLLKKIQERRNKALYSGNLKVYDKIGEVLAEFGVDEAYKMACNE